MSDELKKLQQAFRNEPKVSASESAKNAALKAAINAFELENSELHQGNSNDKRQKKHGHKLTDLFTFSNWRNPMKTSYLLTGAAGLAALALVAINTSQFERFYYADKAIPPATVVRLEEAAQAPDTTTTEAADFQPARVPASPIIDTDQSASVRPVKSRKQAITVAPLSADKERTEAMRSPAATDNKRAAVREKMAYLSDEHDQGLRLASTAACCDEEIIPGAAQARGRDNFEASEINPLKRVIDEPLSTFSIDVDTASYGFMRASINRNILPPKNSVRLEEFINYFPYAYPVPESRQQPFSVNTTVLPSPWNTDTRLLHIGIKGYDLSQTSRLKSNLVFLLDTSGSMNQPDKLPLLQQSFKLLLSSLAPDDTVSIVAYAGSAGTVLEPTPVREKARILNALSQLRAGGSTAGGQGIRLAYQLAEAQFDESGVNRVILATDGDFNVGIRNQDELKGYIERKRDSGIYLSVLGFGMGNYNDALMQALAQNGNGHAAYIDSLAEARKVLVEEATSTLFPIAKDVKIQMEFNPETVSEYRLIGYETRQLKKEDFNNDRVDAGDIGAGHSVTAIYEITPTGSSTSLVDPLRYQPVNQTARPAAGDGARGEYGFLKLRYKLPNTENSRLIEQPVLIHNNLDSIEAGSDDVRFASAVAAYGQILRGGQYTGSFDYDDVIEMALDARGRDPYGYRSEFITLVRLAKSADAL